MSGYIRICGAVVVFACACSGGRWRPGGYESKPGPPFPRFCVRDVCALDPITHSNDDDADKRRRRTI